MMGLNMTYPMTCDGNDDDGGVRKGRGIGCPRSIRAGEEHLAVLLLVELWRWYVGTG